LNRFTVGRFRGKYPKPAPRYIGLDYGDATIGVAVSRGRVATGVETLRRCDPAALRPNLERLRELIAEYGITHVIVGNPLHMDGTPSARSEKTAAFAEKLKRNFKRIETKLWDERLSTQAVARVIGSASHVDEMAAVYILQGYLDYINTRENEMDERIVMTDEDGSELSFDVLATKESGGVIYMLAVETAPEGGDEAEDEAEILHFKCIATEDEEMVFELVEDGHEDFQQVMDLFEAVYEELDIIIEE
jgi:putative Holliday junction resolvase